ncbi:MAG: hypothetical protein V4596_02095 [Bdellovibrionota bacterium]
MRFKRQGGQVIIEYILLMVIVVGIAAAILKGVIHRDKSEAGFLIQAWSDLVQTIGNDCVDNCDGQ